MKNLSDQWLVRPSFANVNSMKANYGEMSTEKCMAFCLRSFFDKLIIRVQLGVQGAYLIKTKFFGEISHDYNWTTMSERLQKILAQAGYGSRRACEDFIIAKRVRVNGKIAELGQKADPAVDKITVDGKPIATAEKLIYIALHKPRNVLSTVEKERGDDRQTVRDMVDVPEHLYPVGRLDFESEGLVLMTNDGELTNRLTHPRFGHTKEYRVLLARRPDQDQLGAWRRGVVLEDGNKTAPSDVRFETAQGKGAWLRVVMGEGRKRQIREICKQLGFPVVRIVRVRIGSLRLGNLKARQWRYLTAKEVEDLKQPEKK